MKIFGRASVLIGVSVVILSGTFIAQTSFAKTSYDALPQVAKGGVFNDTARINPGTLNPLLADDIDSRELGGILFMGLFGTDGSTYEPYPELAEKLEVSKDKKNYTFTLNPKARWSDGTEVTSADVEFTLSKILDPKVDAAPLRSFYDGVSFKKIDKLKFSFHIDSPKFNTQDFLQGFVTLQKKQFEKEADFNKSRENLRPVGNSAYVLKSFSRDQTVIFERDKNWWAKDLPQYKARFNQDNWVYKLIGDNALRYEKFLKGEIDLVTFDPDQYATQVKGTDKDRFGSKPGDGKPVWADQFKSDGTKPWWGLAFNLEQPMFASKDTRKGLAYLVDYKTIIERGYFGLVEQCVSPFGSHTDNTDPGLKSKKGIYTFDPKKAAEFFAKDGWKRDVSEPFLVKDIDGKKTLFRFTLKYYSGNTAAAKAVVILKEIFKKSGVDLELRPMDGTAMYKDFEDRNFEVAFMGWGAGSIHPDPKQLWDSTSVGKGSNKTSYKNPKVDELIKKANLEFSHKKREKYLQEIDRILYDDLPYVFLVERSGELQGINSKFKSPRWTERFGSGVSKDLMHE